MFTTLSNSVITNSDCNEHIWPVPSMFVITKFHCTTKPIWGKIILNKYFFTEAHVGLGIYGREGHAAAQAADFSVCQFKHLQRVFLVHGHWYYNRLAFLVQYSFYKQVRFCLFCLLVRWKPLNVIPLGLRQSDNINQMITLSDFLLIQQIN